jgi:hypothetical protein
MTFTVAGFYTIFLCVCFLQAIDGCMDEKEWNLLQNEMGEGVFINESVLDTDFFTKNKYAQIYFNLPNSTA